VSILRLGETGEAPPQARPLHHYDHVHSTDLSVVAPAAAPSDCRIALVGSVDLGSRRPGGEARSGWVAGTQHSSARRSTRFPTVSTQKSWRATLSGTNQKTSRTFFASSSPVTGQRSAKYSRRGSPVTTFLLRSQKENVGCSHSRRATTAGS